MKLNEITQLEYYYENDFKKFKEAMLSLITVLIAQYAKDNLESDGNDALFGVIESFYVEKYCTHQEFFNKFLLYQELIDEVLVPFLPKLAFQNFKETGYSCSEYINIIDEEERQAWRHWLNEIEITVKKRDDNIVEGDDIQNFDILIKSPNGTLQLREELLYLKETDSPHEVSLFIAHQRRNTDLTYKSLFTKSKNLLPLKDLPFIRENPFSNNLEEDDIVPKFSEKLFLEYRDITSSDEDQKRAIFSPIDTNLVILAGAGSGKTRTLINRLAWLHLLERIPLNRILLITFTKAASREMKDRGELLLSDLYQSSNILGRISINARTIDSFFYGLIKEFWNELGFQREPDFIFDDKKISTDILKNILQENNMKDIFDYHSKENYNNIGYLMKLVEDDLNGIIVNQSGIKHLSENYIQWQIDHCKLFNFTSMAYIIFQSLNSSLVESIANKYSCILVDEFQDINKLQANIFRKLLEQSKIHFTFVGDDDQSIYMFRGADNSVIREMAEHPSIISVYLLTNYRNNPHIVRAGNSILKKLEKRAKANYEIRPNNQSGPKIRITTYSDNYQNISNEVKKLLEIHNYQPEDICVMTRGNQQRDSIIKAFEAVGLPVQFQNRTNNINSSNLYKLFKIYIRTYLNVEVHENCRDFRSIINDRAFFTDDNQLAKIIRGRYENRVAVYVKPWMKLLSDIFYDDNVKNFSDLVNIFALNAAEGKSDIFLDKIQDPVFKEFEKFCMGEKIPWPTSMKQIQALFVNFENNRHYDVNKHIGIHMKTIHSTKGLEYDCTFILGLEDGKFPNTYHLDKEYNRKKVQLDTVKKASGHLEQLRNSIDSAFVQKMVKECDCSQSEDSLQDELKEFKIFLQENSDDLEWLTADIAEEYVKSYRYSVKKYYDDYVRNLAKLRIEKSELNNNIEKKKAKLLNAKNVLARKKECDNAIDNNDLAEPDYHEEKKEIEEIKIEINELQKKSTDTTKDLNSVEMVFQQLQENTKYLNKFNSDCNKAINLFEDASKAREIEEIQKKLDKERQERVNEEKRIFYVALTRARKLLFLCYDEDSSPSEFINIIPNSEKEIYELTTAEEDREIAMLHSRLQEKRNRYGDKEVDIKVEDDVNAVLNNNESLKLRIANKLSVFFAEHPEYSCEGRPEKYLNNALRLYFLMDFSGDEFNMEIIHNFQRYVEERLIVTAGMNAMRLAREQDDRKTGKIIKKIMGDFPPGRIPSYNYFKSFLVKDNYYQEELQNINDLKKLAIMHYLIRSGKFKISSRIRESWETESFSESSARDFLSASIQLANLRNNFIHRNPDQWPENPLPKMFKLVDEILKACQ